MNQDEELAKQILQAYADGKVDLTHVPELQRIVKNAAQEQMARTYDTTDFHAKQEAVLANEQAQFHQQINQSIADTASQLNIEQIEQTVKEEITEQQHKLSLQLLNNMNMQAKLEKQQKFWIPVLLTVLPTMAFLLISFCAIWFIFIR